MSTVTCVFLKSTGTIVTRRDDGSPAASVRAWMPARQSGRPRADSHSAEFVEIARDGTHIAAELS